MPFDPTGKPRLFLPNGTPVLLRPLTPDDRERIVEAFHRLSPESTYFRFWTRFRDLNPDFIDRLCAPEETDHITWIMVLPETDSIPGAGGASFWRISSDPTAAEVSFTVADEFQGQGVGTTLLAALWEHARFLGIQRFVGHVLDSNFVMRAWWDSLGATATEIQRGWEVTLLLDEDLLPDSSAAQKLKRWLAFIRSASS
jgi:RimJ/RimL family protein N-acetyltransferase